MRSEPHFLNMPPEIIKMIIHHVPEKMTVRLVCSYLLGLIDSLKIVVPRGTLKGEVDDFFKGLGVSMTARILTTLEIDYGLHRPTFSLVGMSSMVTLTLSSGCFLHVQEASQVREMGSISSLREIHLRSLKMEPKDDIAVHQLLSLSTLRSLHPYTLDRLRDMGSTGIPPQLVELNTVIDCSDLRTLSNFQELRVLIIRVKTQDDLTTLSEMGGVFRSMKRLSLIVQSSSLEWCPLTLPRSLKVGRFLLSLTHLDLDSVVVGKDFIDRLPLMTSLESLEVRLDLYSSLGHLLHCASVKSLNRLGIGVRRGETVNDFQMLQVSLDSLVHLSIRTPIPMRHVPLLTPSLKSLKCHLHQNSRSFIMNSGSLRELEVVLPSPVDHSIDQERDDPFGDVVPLSYEDARDAVYTIGFLKYLASLTRLTISQCGGDNSSRNINTYEMKLISEHCTNLRHLTISNGAFIHTRSLSFIRSLVSLESLSLRIRNSPSCNPVSCPLGDHLSKLESLDIHQVVGELAVLNSIKNLTTLRQLSYTLDNTTYIPIRTCFSVEQLTTMARSLPNLITLVINGSLKTL